MGVPSVMSNEMANGGPRGMRCGSCMIRCLGCNAWTRCDGVGGSRRRVISMVEAVETRACLQTTWLPNFVSFYGKSWEGLVAQVDISFVGAQRASIRASARAYFPSSFS